MIEKLKITPGPWEVINYLGDVNSVGTDKTDVCDVHNWSLCGKGNAYLIAAAPEMLEVLINIFDGIQQDGDVLKRDIYQMKDIIEKATGMSWKEVKEIMSEAGAPPEDWRGE
jgi:hypothetical protein